ncbi:hypothetical protein KM043_001817 [Ampulex compressa]|nr:hypothetical protein KM043_001817 [Ampulex compressa]
MSKQFHIPTTRAEPGDLPVHRGNPLWLVLTIREPLEEEREEEGEKEGKFRFLESWAEGGRCRYKRKKRKKTRTAERSMLESRLLITRRRYLESIIEPEPQSPRAKMIMLPGEIQFSVGVARSFEERRTMKISGPPREINKGTPSDDYSALLAFHGESSRFRLSLCRYSMRAARHTDTF